MDKDFRIGDVVVWKTSNSHPVDSIAGVRTNDTNTDIEYYLKRSKVYVSENDIRRIY